MAIIVKKLTYADYEKIPPDGHRHEIIEGEEFMTPAPNPDHQSILFKIARRLADHAEARKLGRVFIAATDCVLSERSIVQPDILLISEERTSIIDLLAKTIEIHEFGSPRRVRVYKEGQAFESNILPGLTLRADDILSP